MAKTPDNVLEILMDFCNISPEYIEHAKKTLYKYKDDPVVNLICNVVIENATNVNRLQDLIIEAGINKEYIAKTYPLIIPSPNAPTELRVFPNIILDNHTELSNISPITCQSYLKTFLVEYEADMADDKKKQRWTPQERAEKRILEFIDMPTARALQRYMLTDGRLKDHHIRDYAEAIDSCRKPLELIFTERPEDYYTMYATGPHSCMASSAAERANWEFLKAEGLAPTSWYHYNKYTTGVYAVKAGKVIARTILFKGDNDKNWSWVRIYSTNDEIRKKFTQTLAEHGINQCVKPIIPEGYNFTIPGIKKGSVYAAPWAYLDNPLPSEHVSGHTWNVKFNKEDNNFTFFFNTAKYDKVQSRSGHIISSDYSSIECTSCGKVIKKNQSVINIRVEHEYHIFCSDNCAAVEGYVRAIDGTGNYSYKLPDNNMIELKDNNMLRFTTLKAARACGFLPVIEELGVFPEETNLKLVSSGFDIADSEGNLYFVPKTGQELSSITKHSLSLSKIPFKVNSPKKVVTFEEDKLFATA